MQVHGAATWCLCALVGLLLLQAALVRGGLERFCTLSHFYEQRRLSARTTCSRHLPERLRTICRGRINIPGSSDLTAQMPRRRRATADGPTAALDDDGYGGIFLGKEAASVYLRKRQAEEDSGFQGIVCECCIFPCKRRELMQYCAGGQAAKRKRSVSWNTDVPAAAAATPPPAADEANGSGRR